MFCYVPTSHHIIGVTTHLVRRNSDNQLKPWLINYHVAMHQRHMRLLFWSSGHSLLCRHFMQKRKLLCKRYTYSYTYIYTYAYVIYNKKKNAPTIWWPPAIQRKRFVADFGDQQKAMVVHNCSRHALTLARTRTQHTKRQ